MQVGRLLCLSCHLRAGCCFQSSVTVGGVNFCRCRASWLWAAPPQLRLLNPHKSCGACATLTRHTGARRACGHPAGSYMRRQEAEEEEEEEEEEGLLGFAYEFLLHAAGLVAGSSSSPAFFHVSVHPSQLLEQESIHRTNSQSVCTFAPSSVYLPPPSTPSITLPGPQKPVDHSISMVNRTPVWHKSRQQQCGCCMATKSLTGLCSICRMTRALLPPFLSHLPTYCPRSPSIP